MPLGRDTLEILAGVVGLSLLIAAVLGGIFWFARQRRRPVLRAVLTAILLCFGVLCLYAVFPPWGDPMSTIPVLLLGLLSLGLGGTLVWQTWFSQYRLVRHQLSPVLCEKCHYDLRANRSGACPECGTPLSEQNRRLLTVREAERL